MKTRQELDQYFAKAHALNESGDYSDALAIYLDILDNHQKPRIFGSHHLIDVFSEVIEMGKHHQAATEALLLRRSRWEERILSGAGERKEIHDVHLLNELMEQPEENLRFLNQLSDLRSTHPEAYNEFLSLAWKGVASAGHYAELEACIEDQTQRALLMTTEHHVGWDFASDAEKREECREMLEALLPDTVLIYETLLALGKDNTAAVLVKWLFDCEPLTKAPDLFIAAANKLGKSDVAAQLAQMRESIIHTRKSGNAWAISLVPTSGDYSQDFEGDTP